MHWVSWRAYIIYSNGLSFSKFGKTPWSCNDNMRRFFLVLELFFIVFNGLSSKVTAKSNFWVFKVAPKSFKILKDLMSQFSGVAGNYGLMRLILTTFPNIHLIQDWNNKNCSFAHSWFCLAKNILALKGMGNSIDLNFTRMFKSALSNSSLEFIFQEKFVPTSQISPKLSFTRTLVRLQLLFVRAMIVVVVGNIHDSNNLNILNK